MSGNFGIVPVCDHDLVLQGVISDGDLRRALLDKQVGAFKMLAGDLMNSLPKTINKETLVVDAVSLIEHHKITTALVVDEYNRLEGILRLHDMISAKII
jgi:Mg/Co/Ni transporter MgtE (contains CBS domain)